jgi:hypothetical protein
VSIPRSKQFVADVAKRYPTAWHQYEDIRRRRGVDHPDWPDWCFAPCAVAAHIIGGGKATLGLENSLWVSHLSAAAAWRVTQGIYRMDADLAESLAKTELDRELPTDVLTRLPEWCVFIEANLHWYQYAISGFFAFLEFDYETRTRELRLVLDAGEEWLPISLPIESGSLKTAVEQFVGEVRRQMERFNAKITIPLEEAEFLDQVTPFVSMCLYLCSQEPDLQDAERRREYPARPVPKKTRKGERLFPPDRPTVWEIGFRLGAALRQAREQSKTRHLEDPPWEKIRPIGHIRRAHWHCYWSGSIKRPESRRAELRWLPPISVNLKKIDSLVAVLRPVKAPESG